MTTTEPTIPDNVTPTGDVVEVSAPADGAYVSMLRLTAASLAARSELTIDDIEDLRLAVDEACALVLPHAGPQSRLRARFTPGSGTLAVSVAVIPAVDGELDRDGFGWTVLGALATSVDVLRDGDALAISVVKAREATQP